MADIFVCPNPDCPQRREDEAYYGEGPYACPSCGTILVEEVFCEYCNFEKPTKILNDCVLVCDNCLDFGVSDLATGSCGRVLSVTIKDYIIMRKDNND